MQHTLHFTSKRSVTLSQKNIVRSVALILGLMLTTPNLFAQIAAWNPASPTALSSYGPSPWTATTAGANLTIGGMTRGSGLAVTGTAAGSAWGGVNWPDGDSATARANGRYASFTL